MSKQWAALVLVLIQLHCGDFCPDLCQCFSAEKVVCSDESLKALPFNISSQVRELIVVTSGISFLSGSSFRENLNLTKLVVLNSLVKTISHDAFERLQELEELEISGTYYWLSFDVQTFSSLAKLTRLLLNNNKISALEAGVFHSLHELEMLQLRGNMLSYLPRHLFHRLHNLQELDLSFNHISSISVDVFQNNSLLRSLSLQANSISQLPAGIFSHLDHLEELNLRSNCLSNLSAETFPSGVRKLILKKNALAQLPSNVFHKLHHLTYLDLSQNQLSEVPSDLFQNLISLKKIDLSENRITALPGSVFNGLFSLKAIHLQKNKLSSLEANLLKDQHDLEQLYLSTNSLQSVPQDFFNDLDFQSVVQLHGNPWRCDCGLQYLSEWLKYNGRNVEDLTRVYCDAPEVIRGEHLVTVDKEQLVCRNTSSSGFQGSSVPNVTEILVDGVDDGAIRCSLRDVKGVTSLHCKCTKCTSEKFHVLFEFADKQKSVFSNCSVPEYSSNGTSFH
ncbi:carboxypeptidase N subunit 2 [Puntigrus tetrazona]|uniref:carboxypeptidase N subunit 2 n=1 Tax=Puntigrus tetrazona TaxID=1606681 RepID=UPI001C890652|nr:carboxypeptidase N subunit 2 [Puntigrus tetrazona]XP_043085668.1 carboxypeptidase N subunit 2 [Puntigrus tetrazona]XP_043085669.1 carboxypeptidase N subunit 2 [Puntigrus tetrazona]XP_043085670.1 carboxypeptidase N subunit 2 [Puntigrus tetrazona]